MSPGGASMAQFFKAMVEQPPPCRGRPGGAAQRHTQGPGGGFQILANHGGQEAAQRGSVPLPPPRGGRPLGGDCTRW
jgi:hypothetical protein